VEYGQYEEKYRFLASGDFQFSNSKKDKESDQVVEFAEALKECADRNELREILICAATHFVGDRKTSIALCDEKIARREGQWEKMMEEMEVAFVKAIWLDKQDDLGDIKPYKLWSITKKEIKDNRYQAGDEDIKQLMSTILADAEINYDPNDHSL